jgi:hypothetical protein
MIDRFSWRSLGNLFKRGKRRGPEAQARLARAYQAVFRGENGQIVLADLAKEAGFFRVTPAKGTSSRELWQQEGKRWLYGHIDAYLNLSEADFEALRYAARREAAIEEDPVEGISE